MQSWAIVSEPEQQQLTRQINLLTDRWRAAPSPWKDHWDHLLTAAQRWEQNPETTQLMLDSIAGDYERTGTTDLASPIQVRNLLLAGELAEARRTDLGLFNDPGAPDHVDFVYGYLTSYRTAGHTTTWQSLPSWSTARRWLIDQAAATAPETGVDITITGPDPLIGAAARPLMTGTGLTARELGDQLRHLDQLLGTAAIPVDPYAQSWLDDLRYEVLCDAYRDTLTEHANPWAVGRRFEHYLRADDLYTDIVDYADRAALHHSEEDDPGEERHDTVEYRLADIRQDIRQNDIDWGTAPRTSTWLDEALDQAQQRLDDFARGGLTLNYPDPTQTGHFTEIGFDHDQWYIQHIHTGADGRTRLYDTPPTPYSSCDELFDSTAAFVATSDPSPAPDASIPESIISELRTFDSELTSLHRDLATVRELHDAIRVGSPYTMRRPQPTTEHMRTQSRTGTATSRDANRITLHTPDSEKPTPPAQPAKEPRAKRRQPPKPGGRPHRRGL
ncbi:MAG: hypothetical protein JWN03_3255 [Nocardia sp.]|nr:hypothetical protein [Nocardia sp.]